MSPARRLTHFMPPCRHPGCLAPYHPSSASSHICLFVKEQKDHVMNDDKGHNPLMRAQRRVLKLEGTIKHSENIHQEALRELNKDLCQLSEKIEEVANLETELQTVESKLIDALECPVCWEVAAEEGVVHSCPNGHLVCEPCYKSMNQNTEALCPTCRVPIGSSISLLASVVRENVRHVCGNSGCGERILYQDVAEHRRLCPLSAENLGEASKAREPAHVSDSSTLDSKMGAFGQGGGAATSQHQQLVISDPNRLVPVQITLPAEAPVHVLTVQAPAHALLQGGRSSSTLQQVLTQAIAQALSYPVEHAEIIIQTEINSAFRL